MVWGQQVPRSETSRVSCLCPAPALTKRFADDSDDILIGVEQKKWFLMLVALLLGSINFEGDLISPLRWFEYFSFLTSLIYSQWQLSVLQALIQEF